MFAWKLPKREVIADLTRIKHMNAVSVAVLAYIFVPLVGGPIRAYEVEEVRSFFDGGQQSATAPAAATAIPEQQARQPSAEARDIEVQTVALGDDIDAELTTLQLAGELDPAVVVATPDDETALDETAESQPLDEPLNEMEMLDEEKVAPNA